MVVLSLLLVLLYSSCFFFFLNKRAPPEISPLPRPAPFPIGPGGSGPARARLRGMRGGRAPPRMGPAHAGTGGWGAPARGDARGNPPPVGSQRRPPVTR